MAPRHQHTQQEAMLKPVEKLNTTPQMPTRPPIPASLATLSATLSPAVAETGSNTTTPTASPNLPRPPNDPSTCPRLLIGDLPATLLRQIIFAHLDCPTSRGALARASPSVVIKAIRREPIVPLVQLNPGWPLKRLHLELVLARVELEELVEDAVWWRKVGVLRRRERGR